MVETVLTELGYPPGLMSTSTEVRSHLLWHEHHGTQGIGYLTALVFRSRIPTYVCANSTLDKLRDSG